jgi:hypothetical protein
MALKRIEILVEKDGDRNCPSCKSDDFEIGSPVLRHNRTELGLECHCPHCGCTFRFIYTLFVSDISIKTSMGYTL